MFINYTQNNIAKFLPIAKSDYNNIENINTNYIAFELNYSYYHRDFYKKDINLYSKS